MTKAKDQIEDELDQQHLLFRMSVYIETIPFREFFSPRYSSR